MGLDPVVASDNIIDGYLKYIETTFFINNKFYMEEFQTLLENRDFFAKGPYVDFTDSFKKGCSINDLIKNQIFSKEFTKLFNSESNNHLLSRPLYKHQENSIHKFNEDKNVVVTTGTGSGKTESFLLPIINYLMKQKETNTLNNKVRALIIYPMNALANDQMKRMRELFIDYPEITFGSYTGETEHTNKKAISKYAKLNNGSKPLENERVSREQMKDKPPHILITNYAMLEYLLLRPDDNVLFDNENSNEWKYIVLDEAHSYTGATGIEVSMLLSRLRNTLVSKEKLRFILTSATLGGPNDNKKICNFATNLCAGVAFDESSIVRAIREQNFDNSNSLKVDPLIYGKLAKAISDNDFHQLEKTIKENNLYNDYQNLEDHIDNFLYDFIIKDSYYFRIRELLLDEPKTIKELSKESNLSESEVVSFIYLASKAIKNGVALLDARYHMFVRSLEGAYIVLGKHKRLSIIPEDKVLIDGVEYKSYKISVCQYCGDIYIEGETKTDKNILTQRKDFEFDKQKEIYLIRDEILDNSENYYYLCGKCGRIDDVNIINGTSCNCDLDNRVILEKAAVEKGVLHKCLSCGLTNTQTSILRGFYLGQDAAASVIGSSLYNELPSIEIIKTKEVIEEDDFFGNSSPSIFLREETLKKDISKQLLVFSDSRQSAAYFSTYFNFTYNNILRRRLLIEALHELGPNSGVDGIDIIPTVKKLASLFELHNIDFGDDYDKEKEAWKTLLYEISSNDRNSLENLGLISFEYQARKSPIPGKYNYNLDESVSIQRELANSFRRDCMLYFPAISDMTKEDKEFYLNKLSELTMTLTQTDEERKKDKYVRSWISKYKNKRSKYVLKTRNKLKDDEVNSFLENIWNKILKAKNGGLIQREPDRYILNIEKFKIRTLKDHKIEWFLCEKCKKITINNINYMCPSPRCSGQLKDFDVIKFNSKSHYIKQFTEQPISSMVVKEHTAQLSPDKAKEYQEKFINREINVLSCSTTFEMGVDVGELETVFMRNMPPTPANYTQRAGRAGRRSDSVAYALTFCKLASHDLNYFNNPNKMIKGRIKPPQFKVENEKIVKRHLNAMIFSSFWKNNPPLFNDVRTFFDENLFVELIEHINHLSEDFNLYIYNSIPKKLHKKIPIWLEDLISEKGPLFREYYMYRDELKELSKLREKTSNEAAAGNIKGYHLDKIDSCIKKLQDESILPFLSKKNLIPKYGFPVETVELSTSLDPYRPSTDIRLQRDLQIAISEYAPGSEVIADGNIYVSQYIKKPTSKDKDWTKYDFGICSNIKCGQLNIKKHIIDDGVHMLDNCIVCGEQVEKKNTFIIPEYGFIINPSKKKATTKKPKKTYRGDIYYIGDRNTKTENLSKDYTLNKISLSIKSTSNDELAVINNANFYVCETCGYASVDTKRYSPSITDPKQHKTSYGKDCKNKKRVRRTLGHTFKTDVLSMSFYEYLNKENSYSILYSLLEGISDYLGIERNDISGTIQYKKIERGVWITNFILFDTVPGGAGHVRRIGNSTEEQLREIFKQSLAGVEQCTCGAESNAEAACYSCLCNYYNQKHHDMIKRRYAIDFLQKLV